MCELVANGSVEYLQRTLSNINNTEIPWDDLAQLTAANIEAHARGVFGQDCAVPGQSDSHFSASLGSLAAGSEFFVQDEAAPDIVKLFQQPPSQPSSQQLSRVQHNRQQAIPRRQNTRVAQQAESLAELRRLPLTHLGASQDLFEDGIPVPFLALRSSSIAFRCRFAFANVSADSAKSSTSAASIPTASLLAPVPVSSMGSDAESSSDVGTGSGARSSGDSFSVIHDPGGRRIAGCADRRLYMEPVECSFNKYGSEGPPTVHEVIQSLVADLQVESDNLAV